MPEPPQGGRGLHADEAGADDHHPGRPTGEQGAQLGAVVDGAQRYPPALWTGQREATGPQSVDRKP